MKKVKTVEILTAPTIVMIKMMTIRTILIIRKCISSRISTEKVNKIKKTTEIQKISLKISARPLFSTCVPKK